MDEKTGRPYKTAAFQHAFAAIRALAASSQPTYKIDYLLPGRDPNEPDAFLLKMVALQFLHLRHTAVTRLAEAGCDLVTIASVTGHSSKTVEVLMGHYLVKTRQLARIAFEKRETAEAQEIKRAPSEVAQIIPFARQEAG